MSMVIDVSMLLGYLLTSYYPPTGYVKHTLRKASQREFSKI